MRPERYDLVDGLDSEGKPRLRGIRAGEDFAFPVTLKLAGGALENLTGRDFAFRVRRSRGDATVLIEATTLDGRIVNGGMTGALTVFLPHELTARLSAMRGFYGLSEIAPDREPRLEGEIDIVKAVVR